jgi:hypothetical protein
MKLATPIGALSGKRVQVSLPAVVSITAVGWLDPPDDFACAHKPSEDRKMIDVRIKYLRIDSSLSVIDLNLELYDSGNAITG